MKKAFSILLLSLYLFSTTELYQVLKFPILIEHYFEHKAITPQLTFADFLSAHYNNRHTDNILDNYDFEQDQKLPFMMNAGFFSAVFVSHDIPSIEIEHSLFFVEDKKFPLANDSRRDKAYLSAIWQPPRMV